MTTCKVNNFIQSNEKKNGVQRYKIKQSLVMDDIKIPSLTQFRIFYSIENAEPWWTGA